jgi:pimeloyl-ACP methyl ester carboxylesterase
VRRRGFASSPRAHLSRSTRLALATTLAAAALAGCTAGPSTRPEVIVNDGTGSHPSSQPPPAPPAVPLPALTPPQSPSIKWSDCSQDTRDRLGQPGVPDNLSFSCGKVNSTLDSPDLPNRGLARIAVLKVGTGPIPLVVVNDIDGDPGTLYAARLAAVAPPALLQKFSLIGVDRRGTGQSMPMMCVPAGVRQDLLDQDPASDDLDGILQAARRAGQQCAIDLDTATTALDSWRTAADLDQVRQQLGMTKLNAFGHGDGSKVLSEYAVRYPGQVGRFALDGVPDPSTDAAAVLDNVAAGLQATVTAFGQDCAKRGCALGADAGGAIGALVAKVRATPLITQDGSSAGPGLTLTAISAGLAQRARWPELADAISAAQSGDFTKLEVFSDPMSQETRLNPSRLDAAIATKCNDSATRMPADQITKVTRTLRQKYPLFGDFTARQLAWCLPWQGRSEPLPPAGAPGAPPILVASTAVDPVTPGDGTSRAADQMPSAVQVSWQGAGHGAFGNSSCVTDAVSSFLVDGAVPRDGTLCPA